MFIDCIKGQEQTEVSTEGRGTDFMGHLVRLSFLLSTLKRGKKFSLLVYFFPPRFPKRGRNRLLISIALRWILTVQQVAVCTEFDALTLIPELLNVTF